MRFAGTFSACRTCKKMIVQGLKMLGKDTDKIIRLY